MCKKRKPAQDGEWIEPIMNGYQMECCDCGLVHRMNFRILEKTVNRKRVRKIQFQAFRNNRATGQVRRYKNFFS